MNAFSNLAAQMRFRIWQRGSLRKKICYLYFMTITFCDFFTLTVLYQSMITMNKKVLCYSRTYDKCLISVTLQRRLSDIQYVICLFLSSYSLLLIKLVQFVSYLFSFSFRYKCCLCLYIHAEKYAHDPYIKSARKMNTTCFQLYA